MLDAEKRKRFVELRGRGVSYVKISEEIGVCKSTLINWSKEYRFEINNAKAMELEGIREEYLLGREHRMQVLGTELGKVTEEILKRDLSEVSTHQLFEMQRKLVSQIRQDDWGVSFTVQEEEDDYGTRGNSWKRTTTWTG